MSAQQKSPRRSTLAGKRPSLLMALEPRMLYDGAGAEVVADAAAAEALVPQDSSAAQETASPENGAASQPAAEPAEAGAQETAAGEGQGSSDDAAAAPAVSGQEEAGSAAGTSPAAATNGNSAANTTAASHDAGAAPPDAEDEETAAAATEATATGSADHDDRSGTEADTAEPLAGLEGQSIRQVVFVDSAVRDHQTLVDGISGGSEAGPAGTVGTSGYSLSGSTLVVTLGEKPLDDMHAVLEHCHDLDAVHLVSHGSEGELMLGGNRINAGNLGEHAGLFERLGKSLSADGDLLLYGCKVGRDGAGQAFIDQVAALSGADVNASTDDTGNASSGGNWNLEVATGPIETAALLNEQNVGNWQGTLAQVTIGGQDLLRHMTYNGTGGNTAAAVDTDTFRLTRAEKHTSGSAMSNILIDLTKDFTLEFKACFSAEGQSNDAGADGIAFVLHKDPRGLHATGSTGKGIGAQGIEKGLAVEFDTYWNQGEDENGYRDHTSVWDTDESDPATKYLNVQSGGSSSHIQILPKELEDGQWHAVSMSWNADSKMLSYTIDGKTMSVRVDPRAYFGGTEVYFGFTASTGGSVNEHSVQLVSLKGTLVNKEPVAHADTVTAQAGKTVQVDVVQNDTDADPGDQAALHVTAIYDERDSATAIPINPGQTITLSSGTRVTLEHDGKLSVVMAQGTNDQEAFYYTVSDDKGGFSKAAVHLQRDSDGDGVANVEDIDDDNDGILDANEGHKCVVKESFETPKSQNVHNNWYPGGTSLNGFETDGAGFNVIAVGDGSPGETLHYNYSGPDVAQDGLQYLDLGGTGTLSKTFTLSEQSLVDVSGWFSRRELASGTVKIDILDSSNNVVFSTTSVDLAGASRNTWYLSQAYGQSLAAGTYTLRIQLPNNLNVDNIRVCASRDSDGDGKADRLDIDSDNDGITDNVEAQATRGYKPPSGHDVDRDGLDDAYDANLGGAAASQGLTPVDTDSDGTADVLDADSDNDGIADIAERADGQPTTLTSPADTDGDGLLDIFEAGNVHDGFDVNDKNWDSGQFNLGRVPALNPDGSNAVPLTDGQSYSRDLLFRDVNDPPVAVDDIVTTPEDTPLNGNVLNNDSDPDGDTPLIVGSASIDTNGDGTPDSLNLGTPTTLTNNAGVTIGTLLLRANGSYTFTPALNYSGPVPELSYTVKDPGGKTATAKLKIAITPVNDPPVANPDTATTPEDTPINNINVLGNDSDPDGDPLSVTSATVDPAKGTVGVNPDGTLNFVPTPGFTGTAIITYTISDGHGGTATSTVTVSVQPPHGGTHRPSPAHPHVPSAPSAPAPRPPFGSTGLHILYGSPASHGLGAGPWSGGQTAAGPEAAFAGTGAEGTETPRMLGLDTGLDFDHNGDQLVGTEISQYIHDTVNHTWERVERWYGTGTPGAELLRYDALGGAQDPFNGFHSPIESRMLEDLGRLLDNVVSGSALSGDGASGLLPVFAESRTLQNQLSRADIMGREVDRLSRIMDGGH
ncbi:Ig-like domain-containing protein [Desulfobulbus oralis]|nr:DUF4347 domain-containing protein [Desulfobulbus oralis]